jgi:C-terminal processing protease CtpA/Prc
MSTDRTAYDNLIGPGKAGVTNKFLFETPLGKDSVIMSTKTSFKLNSVLMYDTLHLTSGITGHLVFESFITPSEDELAEAFSYFKATGVTDLILDLRYNSGGYLYIAQQLASYIAGNSLNGSPFIKMVYNNKHQGENNSFNFINTASPLGLTRLVVLTSWETASASECVMNGLKPYIDVVSIGDTTNGKPVGMDGGDIGKKYFIAPVTFKSINKDNESDYFDGLPPIANVDDDITRDFNNREELCLKSAIEYLENGTILSKGGGKGIRHSQFSEKPGYLGNTFVLKEHIINK